jgi:hypothetical protein
MSQILVTSITMSTSYERNYTFILRLYGSTFLCTYLMFYVIISAVEYDTVQVETATCAPVLYNTSVASASFVP